MQAIKLVVTDIDGTIMPEGTPCLNPLYYDLVRQLHAKGIVVVIASGRQTESIARLFEPVLDCICMIGNGGLCVTTPRGSRILQVIPPAWIAEMDRDIAALDAVDALFCGLNESYAHDPHCEMVRRMAEDYHVEMTMTQGVGSVPEVPLGKVSLFREHSLEQTVQGSFAEKWRERLTLTMAGDYWLDCVMPGVSKASALQLILDEWGIAASAVLASGDQMNDVEMLKLAGRSIAVSNAREELKLVASEVHENSDYLAVARAWKALL